MAIKKELSNFQGNERPTIHFSEQTWFILNDDREKFSHDDEPLPFSAFLNMSNLAGSKLFSSPLAYACSLKSLKPSE